MIAIDQKDEDTFDIADQIYDLQAKIKVLQDLIAENEAKNNA